LYDLEQNNPFDIGREFKPDAIARVRSISADYGVSAAGFSGASVCVCSPAEAIHTICGKLGPDGPQAAISGASNWIA